MQIRHRLVAVVAAVSVGVGAALWTTAQHASAPVAPAATLPGAAPATSPSELERAASAYERHLADRPDDSTQAARYAELLLRRARVESNGGYVARADRLLTGLLAREPGDYAALRALGAVRLAQHRFRQAIDVAERAARIRPDDAWNHGVLGDAYVELGDYDRAFASFDEMMRLRPDAAAYARVAYAHELQGRLEQALRVMTLATEATPPNDVEALAWHYAQLGLLQLQLGNWATASRHFAHAEYVFPGHPYARSGRARLARAQGDVRAALTEYEALMAVAPNAEAALGAADTLVALGRTAEAVGMFERAEALERDAWRTEFPQPANVARILADRGIRLSEAVQLAEAAAASRRDIFTMDTLAWSYFRSGRVAEAKDASMSARRTGSRDARILAHAAEIDAAAGNEPAARTGRPPLMLLERAGAVQ